MEDKFAIQLFEGSKVRVVWDEEQEKYFFSVADVIQILTDSVDAVAYWRKLKQRKRNSNLKSSIFNLQSPISNLQSPIFNLKSSIKKSSNLRF